MILIMGMLFQTGDSSDCKKKSEERDREGGREDTQEGDHLFTGHTLLERKWPNSLLSPEK